MLRHPPHKAPTLQLADRNPQREHATTTIDNPLTDTIATLPKVLLHGHLDGSIQPDTLIELAEAPGYHHLSSSGPATGAAHLHTTARRGPLNDYPRASPTPQQ